MTNIIVTSCSSLLEVSLQEGIKYIHKKDTDIFCVEDRSVTLSFASKEVGKDLVVEFIRWHIRGKSSNTTGTYWNFSARNLLVDLPHDICAFLLDLDVPSSEIIESVTGYVNSYISNWEC